MGDLDLVEEFLAREKSGLSGLENDIPSAFNSIEDFGANEGLSEEQLAAGNDGECFYKGQPPASDVPEKIKKWRDEHQTRLQEKDAAEEISKEVLRNQAKEELADWYKRHEEAIGKTKLLNRNAEKENIAATDEIEPGSEWARMAKLCDFSQSTKASKSVKDNSRMRSIILQLKQSPIDREKACSN